MTPTEHELTVATEAIARTDHEAWRKACNETNPSQKMAAWDDLSQYAKHAPLERALPLAVAALDALPDRRTVAVAEVQRLVDQATETGFAGSADRLGRLVGTWLHKQREARRA